jgi:hypothetical protein
MIEDIEDAEAYSLMVDFIISWLYVLDRRLNG